MLEITMAPMSLEQKTFGPGDTVRVTVSFKYVVGVNTTIRIMAGPFHTDFLGKHMVSNCVGEADVTLSAVSTPTEASATVDFTLIPDATGGARDGVYGLRVWIEDTNILVEQQDVIVITGNSSGGSTDVFSAMMPMLMMVMMLGMIMPMTSQLGQGEEEESESLS